MITIINKNDILKYAIEITKEYGRGGTGKSPKEILEEAYNKIVELNDSSED